MKSIYIWIILLLTSTFSTYADQTTIPDYDETQKNIFWEKLYYYAGWTLYCGSPFYQKARGLQIEHVYPASWMAQHLGCGTRTAAALSAPTPSRH